MPKLVKGGKLAYGWIVVGAEGELTIPPQAMRDYDFQAGEVAIFLPGSRCSGGFGISTPRLIGGIFGSGGSAGIRLLGQGRFGENGRVFLPPELGFSAGGRLLAVRGSRYGLGFVAQGPIYQEAFRHPELEIYSVE
jgi:hypothetical protein